MAKKKLATRFPDESAEYRRARNRLLQSEVKLRRQIEAVAEQRRKLPLGGAVKTDYVFDAAEPGDGATRKIRLSELFADGKRTLFVYNFMFPQAPDMDSPCPTCTSIIDAVEGADREVPAARPQPRLAARAAPVFIRQHVQSRLRRGGRQWPAVAAGACVRAPRKEDPSLLVERALVGQARAGPGHATRGFHVADVGNLRCHTGRPQQELGAEPLVPVIPPVWCQTGWTPGCIAHVWRQTGACPKKKVETARHFIGPSLRTLGARSCGRSRCRS